MHFKIKKRVDKELKKFLLKMDRLYSLSKISPLLFAHIKNFVLRDGKRIRPLLFIIGYRGFAKKIAKNLYASALSIELLHDFMLVHDDIIDKSDLRRGKPSMHRLLNDYLETRKNVKFSGQDLALIVGDVIYALSIHAFLSIKENMQRKEKALRKFIEAAMYTGCGEFIELMNGIKDSRKLTKQDIYNVYDYKTAQYTFSCPISTGAMLAGASKKEINKLFKYGIYLGRAFQIKDDILGMFGEEKDIGKSCLTDLKEAKKTILIWHAYNHSAKKDRQRIEKMLGNKKVNKNDLLKMRQILIKTGSLDYSKKEIIDLINRAQFFLESSKIKNQYKTFLTTYTQKLLN